MKTNDTIKVHLYDLHNKEIQTRNYGKTFCVYEKAGKLGIDWNTGKSPYTCKYDVFAPFETFAPLERQPWDGLPALVMADRRK